MGVKKRKAMSGKNPSGIDVAILLPDGGKILLEAKDFMEARHIRYKLANRQSGVSAALTKAFHRGKLAALDLAVR